MKYKSLLAFLFISLVLINFSCKKNVFDFRNKYVGDYEFVYTYSSWQMNLGVYASGTNNYSGRVYYDKNTKDKIKIEYNNSTLDLGIDKDGNLSLACGTSAGKFESKSKLTINSSSNACPGGGLGGGTNYSLIGTKK